LEHLGKDITVAIHHPTCECSDPKCPTCKGKCTGSATHCLVRIDTEDKTGTLMCEGCASDALASGLYEDRQSLFRRIQQASQ
jgi:hypothetical protein